MRSGRLSSGHPHALFPCGCLDQFESCVGKQIAENAPIVFLVFDDENAPGSYQRTPRCDCSKRQREPESRSLSQFKLDPEASAVQLQQSFFEMARPRPVPPLVRVLELSSCRNSSNTSC